MLRCRRTGAGRDANRGPKQGHLRRRQTRGCFDARRTDVGGAGELPAQQTERLGLAAVPAHRALERERQQMMLNGDFLGQPDERRA